MFFDIFHKLKVPEDLQDGFCEIGGLIFPVLLDCGYKSRVFRPNILQHCGLEVHLSALLSIK